MENEREEYNCSWQMDIEEEGEGRRVRDHLHRAIWDGNNIVEN